jgi:glycosyltransferase involved in cell wall biosynthesis
LAAGGRARGADIRVAALLQLPGEHPFVVALRAGSVPVEEIRCGRRRYGAESQAVADLVRRTRPAVVHTHVYHADLVGYRAARAAGSAVVATVHGFTDGDLKNRFYQWLDIRALRRFDALLCVAESVRARVLLGGVDPGRVHLVPNAVLPAPARTRAAAREILGVPTDGRLVGWVGRLSPEKGPDLFLDALAQLALPEVRAVVIGDGPQLGALSARCAALGRGGPEVLVAGARSDAASLLTAFDVLVLSSRTEGLPLVLLEAMAAGVPVVSFWVGGIPDVVSPASAFLAPPGDVSALAAVLRMALENPEGASARAAQARIVVEERFGIEPWLARVEAVYAAVAGS